MVSRIRQVVLGLLAGTCLLACLVGAAWLGIAAAKKTLPEEALAPSGPEAGEVLTLGATEEPLYLAEDLQSLRDFYFSYPTADARRDGDAEARNLRRIFENLQAKLRKTDGDGAEIEILDGPLAGVKGWIHLDQWKAVTPAEAPAAP